MSLGPASIRARRARPIVAALAAAALAGCGGNYAVYGAGTSAGGAAVVADGGFAASISLGSSASSLIAAGGIAAVLAAGNSLSPLPPPPMRTDRTINEQDCTRPIERPAANLKCR